MTPGIPPAAAERGPRLAGWLLRPFIDLSPPVVGPLYARSIEEYWRAFADPTHARFALQRTLPPAFRAQLISECGIPQHGFADPRELPASLRNERWSSVCEALDHWTELPAERKRALVLLLHALCLYQPVLKLVPEFRPEFLDGDETTLELSYWRESARYVRGVPSRIADYGAADVSVFKKIATESAGATRAAFNASVKVFVHKAKTGADARELARWSALMERTLAAASAVLDDFEADLFKSRYYRALGYLPLRRGDRKQVVRLMSRAERHARRMRPATGAQQLLYLENLHPLLESRTKEALWLGDLDLALRRARQVVRVDPYDSKTWVELGQVRMKRREWREAADAYITAAMLGPPASAIGRHMAAVCLRKCGNEALAAFLFKDVLEIDRLGISPHVEIGTLRGSAAFNALKLWSLRAF